MKKLSIIVLILSFALAYCGKGDKKDKDQDDNKEKIEQQKKELEQNDNVSQVTLTSELIEKYINTFPGFVKTGKKMGKEFGGNAPVYKATAFGEEITKYLKEKGWESTEKFLGVHTKISIALPWLMTTSRAGGNMPDKVKKRIEEQYAKSLRKISDDEKKLLKDYSSKIINMFRSLDKQS